jgi:hypothetical protein
MFSFLHSVVEAGCSTHGKPAIMDRAGAESLSARSWR